MKRIRLGAAAAFLGAALSGCVSAPPPLPPFTPPPAPPTAAAVVRPIASRLLGEARRYVYRVRSASCLTVGSAFAAAGQIVTNRHVAAGSGTLDLSTWSGSDFQAQVSAISRGPDLAVLDSAHRSLYPAAFNTEAITRGTQVWVAGYPRGNQLTIRAGRVLRVFPGKRIGVPGRLLEISAEVQHGNSGGPLLNAQGQIVGVVFAKLRRNGHGLAIPAADLARFMRSPGHFTDVGCIY